MKLINSSFKLIHQEKSLQSIADKINFISRVLFNYKYKIKYDTIDNFIKSLKGFQYKEVFKHCTIYLDCPLIVYQKYCQNIYSKVNYIKEEITADEEFRYSFHYYQDLEYYFVTTTLDVIIYNNWIDDLQYFCEPTKHHYKRISVKLTSDFCSCTKILNYKKFTFSNILISKYENNNLTFIIPDWCDLAEGEYDFWDDDWVEKRNNKITNTILKHYSNDNIDTFLESCLSFENFYNVLINKNISRENIQHLLPLSIKSDIFITGYISDWELFLNFDINNNDRFIKIFTPLKLYLKDKL